MGSGSFKKATYKQFVYKSYILYMYKQDLALNNLQRLICYKTQPIKCPKYNTKLSDGDVLVLYFDLRPGQTCHSKVMHRKEVTHSNGSYERKLRRRKLADEMGQGKKSHDALIDWCTGREWPLNCMTVISAWWQSNMPFQRLSGRWTII